MAIAREIGGAQCRIVALYVSEEIPQYAAADAPKDVRQRNLALAHAELRELADEVGAESAVRSGYSPGRIVEFAAAIGADLIVLDSHRVEPEDYVLGSPAVRIVWHAKCPVLVYPPSGIAERPRI